MKFVDMELSYIWGKLEEEQVYITAKQFKILRKSLFIKSFAHLSWEISFLTMFPHHSNLQNPVLSYGFNLSIPISFPPFSISSNLKFIVLRLSLDFTISFQIISSGSQCLDSKWFGKTFYLIKKTISNLRKFWYQVRWQYIYPVKIIYLSFSLKSFIGDDQWFLNCKTCCLCIFQWIAYIYLYRMYKHMWIYMCVNIHNYIVSFLTTIFLKNSLTQADLYFLE